MKIINTIQFLDDGAVVLTYLDPATDVRNRELLLASHQLCIRPGRGGRDYLDEIEDVRDAARRLLDDALEDWATTTDVGAREPVNQSDRSEDQPEDQPEEGA